MKSYLIEYCLGNMHHSFVIDAENEVEAILKSVKALNEPSMMHDFKVSRYFEEWN